MYANFMDCSSFAIENLSGRQRLQHIIAPSVTQKHRLKFKVGWELPGRGDISRFLFGKAAIFQVPCVFVVLFSAEFFFKDAIGKLS